MSKVVKRRDFLQLLANSKNKRRQTLLEIATSDEIKAIIELLYNILHGSIKLSTKDLQKLRKYKKLIREITEKKKNVKQVKGLLKQKGGFLLPLAIPLVLAALKTYGILE